MVELSLSLPLLYGPLARELTQCYTLITSIFLSLKLKGTVSRFYHDFERFKNTPRSYIT